MKYYRIALGERTPSLFTYWAHEELETGRAVEVDFRSRRRVGIVWEETEAEEGFRIKPVLRKLPFVVPSPLMQLAQRLQEIYLQPMGQYLQLMLPPMGRGGKNPLYLPTVEGFFLATSGNERERLLVEALLPRPYTRTYLRRKLGKWVDYYIRKLRKLGFLREVYPEKKQVFSPASEPYLFSNLREVNLTEEAERAAEKLTEFVGKGFSPHLLYGITGSGKTFVLLKVIEEVVKMGGGVLYLVPEISMVPFPYQLLSSRFSGVEIIHSMKAHGQREGAWARLASGESRIVIGARSAVFAPVRNLYLIIVDEEHDLSYDQETSPRYNAVQVAEERGKIEGAMVIFSSATPSIGNFLRAKNEEIHLHVLKKRLGELPLPQVNIVSMKGKGGLVSREFAMALEEETRKGSQALVLMNRRGFTSFLQCSVCGYVPLCPHCELPLTYHREENTLQCHYCGYEEEPSEACPLCGGEMKPAGAPGLQKLLASLREMFPDLKIERFDADVARRKNEARRILREFYQGEINVLVGTQLISKGHNFPGVTLVGVFFPDLLLRFPDFTSSERTFQLITQMIGRAGRVERGRAIIQTRYPEHHAIKSAASQDYEEFFRREVEFRRRLLYPPFVKLVRILMEYEDRRELGAKSRYIYSLLQGFRKRGPVLAPFQKIGGRWRAHIFVEFQGEEKWEEFKRLYWNTLSQIKGVSVIVAPAQVL